MEIGISLSLTSNKGVGRAPQAFVTTKAGTWTDPTTWTAGADYPRLLGDTWTVNHNVTISSGTTGRGSGTVTSGKAITISGLLELGGNVTGSLTQADGGVLDLRGYNVQAVSGTVWSFVGSAGSRCAVRSTGGRGRFLSGVFSHTHTYQFCDISGLGPSVHGRSHTSAVSQIEEDCIFDDNESWSVEDTSTNVNAGVKFNRNRVRSMHGAGATILIVQANQALGTAPREITGNSLNGGGVLARITLQNAKGFTMGADQVIKDFQIYPTRTDAFVSFGPCTWYNSTGDDQAFVPTGALWANAFDGDLLFYDGGNHPLGYQTIAIDAKNLILEATNSNGATDWFLRAANTTATLLTNVLALGHGTVQTNTAANSGDIILDRVTAYIAGEDQKIASILIAEQSAVLSGVTSLKNSLITNSDSTKPFSAVWLQSAAGGQLDEADYNGGYGFPGGATTPANKYLAGSTPTQISGLGVHDLSINPEYADQTRAFATWDASLGGPGTAAHAIAEMLKFLDADYNSAYTRTAAKAWIGAGFVPTGAGATAYNGTGAGGSDIGYRP